jgi:hypothetical protein
MTFVIVWAGANLLILSVWYVQIYEMICKAGSWPNKTKTTLYSLLTNPYFLGADEVGGGGPGGVRDGGPPI